MSLIKANFSSIFLTWLGALPTKKDFKIPVPFLISQRRRGGGMPREANSFHHFLK